jgi:hypothetical protein
MLNEILTGTQSNSDGLIVKARGTRDGAQVIQSMHGPYYEAALRGNVFHASTIIAGKIVLVAAATLAGVFTIHNPLGSNRNVELISFSFGLDSATIVVNTIGILIQRNLTATSGIPTSTTAGSVHRLGLSGTNFANFYSVATLTNVAIPGAVGSAVPIPFYPMVTMPATADTNIGDYRHEFKGKIILEPDSLVSVCSTNTTATVSPMAMDWAEWLVA